MWLCVILRRRFDLQNPSRMDRNVEMFLNVEKNLVQVQDRVLMLELLLMFILSTFVNQSAVFNKIQLGFVYSSYEVQILQLCLTGIHTFKMHTGFLLLKLL